MASSNITSAQVGTAVVAAAGTLKGLAITMPIAANADFHTPLTLIDATVANPVGPTLFSALLGDLSFIYGVKPTSVPITPGSPTGPAPGVFMVNGATPFAKGLYVRSCPANVTFTATT
jgi:hypothetical protein